MSEASSQPATASRRKEARSLASKKKKPPTSRPTRSKPELQLAAALKEAGVRDWVEEHRFHPTRKWRFDFAWPSHQVAVEVEGGAFSGGRHTRGMGFVADCEKYNAAVLAGWLVLRFVPSTGWIVHALPLIEDAIQYRHIERYVK